MQMILFMKVHMKNENVIIDYINFSPASVNHFFFFFFLIKLLISLVEILRQNGDVFCYSTLVVDCMYFLSRLLILIVSFAQLLCVVMYVGISKGLLFSLPVSHNKVKRCTSIRKYSNLFPTLLAQSHHYPPPLLHLIHTPIPGSCFKQGPLWLKWINLNPSMEK